MKQGTSKKILLIFLVILIALLVGVAIFIAGRLQNTQAPTDSSAARVAVCDWCEGIGGELGSCPTTPFQYSTTLCRQPNGIQLNCCFGHYEGSDDPVTPPGVDPGRDCVIQYNGSSVTFSAGCAGRDLQYFHSSYDGIHNTCPTTENGESRFKVGASGGTYSANPQSGECRQLDYHFSGVSPNGSPVPAGGVCACTPPVAQPKYKCVNNACVQASDGTYTNSNCDNACTTTTTRTITPASVCPASATSPNAAVTWGTGSAPTRIDVDTDNNWNNGYWTKSSGITGASATIDNTFTPSAGATGSLSIISNTTYYVRAFFGTSTPTATASFIGAQCNTTSASISAASTCPTGSTTPNATITWSPATPLPTEIQIDNDNNWSNGYYRKTSLSGSSTTAPTGFTGTAGASGTLTLTSSATYYVRAFYQSTNSYSNIATFSAAQCQVTSQAQCISLDENGSDPLASGSGNFVIYTLIFQNSATSDPYPNMRLRVGNTGSPVGRDANTPSSALVKPFNVTRDSVTNRYTYLFRWEAASTAGANVSAGTYNVRVLTDGTTDVTSPSACTETLTISQTAVEEPLFNILKQAGAPSCQADGSVIVNYTITITNIGSVPGTLDFVQDTYDAQAYSLGILPTNINPSYGVVNTGKITWTGDNTQRTYTAGQAKTFTYTIRVPASNLTTFSSTGLYNQALVQYDTSTTNNNTASFNLRTFLSCTIIPATGIIDDYKFILIGVLFIVLGLIAFQFRIGNQLSLILLEGTFGTINNRTRRIIKKVKPYEESIIDEMEKKREK